MNELNEFLAKDIDITVMLHPDKDHELHGVTKVERAMVIGSHMNRPARDTRFGILAMSMGTDYLTLYGRIHELDLDHDYTKQPPILWKILYTCHISWISIIIPAMVMLAKDNLTYANLEDFVQYMKSTMSEKFGDEFDKFEF